MDNTNDRPLKRQKGPLVELIDELYKYMPADPIAETIADNIIPMSNLS